MLDKEEIKNSLSVLNDLISSFDINSNIDEYLTQKLVSNNIYDYENSLNTIKDISSTLDTIKNLFQELTLYKESGKSTSSWLKKELNYSLSSFSPEEKSNILKEIKNNLSNSNSSIINLFTNENISLDRNITSYDFEDEIIANSITSNLQDTLKNNVIVKTLSNKFYIEDSNLHQNESNLVKDFFISDMDSDSEYKLKKIASTALVISKEKGFIKALKNISSDKISMIVDGGLSTVKIGYKLFKGELSAVDCLDYLIDRGAATLSTIVKNYSGVVGSNAGQLIGASIGTVFGPVGTSVGATIGRAAGYFVGNAIGSFVSSGVEKLADFCKSSAKSFFNKGTEMVSNFVSKVFG
jgi:hypothetical protein